MGNPLGEKMKECVIIAGGEIKDFSLLKQAVKGKVVVCADSGLDHANSVGIKTDVLVGDMDSVKSSMPQNTEIIRLPVRKDDTDLHFAVKEMLKRGYDEFSIFGAYGSRIDQFISALATLKLILEKGKRAVIYADRFRCFLLEKGKEKIRYEEDVYVSVFPFCNGVTVGLKGFDYSADMLHLDKNSSMGVSNELKSDGEIEVFDGTALVFIVKKD